ncbi:coiled-coil domain-containing protein 186 isoform X3 [Chrysoperla carnea]|uniref:coiled-coil domain-containing protein 186 isoform X3 n=1 Tax=Chrysoperla carnea TaxID=189513 RepID=UPI001D09758D|nr:coiled-coil domain-containing protein 186 isoform X3 [Chrysoperla carnea]
MATGNNISDDESKYINKIQYVNDPSDQNTSMSVISNNESDKQVDNVNVEEVVAVGDEGISDCSPGASERDSYSPAPNDQRQRSSPKKSSPVTPNKFIESTSFNSDYPDNTSPSLNPPESLEETKIENEVHEQELSELRLSVAKYKVDLERAIDHIHYLEEVNLQQGLARAEVEAKYQTAIQRYESAKREKEATVMRYAVSEKNVIDQKNARELLEKQLRDAMKEIELLNNKVSLSASEKNRICQLFDNKCHELFSAQRECEKYKGNLFTTEQALKNTKSALKSEQEARRDLQHTIETLNSKLSAANTQIETAKREAQDSIRTFRESQENKAFMLDKQLKEVTANLILVRHECGDREQRSHYLQLELDKLQEKFEKVIQENNQLSLKVQQLELERFETDKKLAELRETKNKESEQTAKSIALESQLEQIKLKLESKEEKYKLMEIENDKLRQQNFELQNDIENCVHREEEMLKFTQTLTEKNVRLQSESSAIETKVQQLQCEQENLRRSTKEMQSKINILTKDLEDEKEGRNSENTLLTRHVAEKTQEIEKLKRELEYQKGENQVLKRKFDTTVKQMTKELQHCHKTIESLKNSEEMKNSYKSSSQSSDVSNSPSPINRAHETVNKEAATISTSKPANTTSTSTSPIVLDTPIELDKSALLEHVMRLQRISARKSEKLDFLESHVQTLVGELQKKSRLLQDYMVREQTGALTSNAMDNHKRKYIEKL